MFGRDFWDAIVVAVHVLAATIFIGPQVFLAAIAIPAVRDVQDAATRQRLTRAVTRGFGMLGGIALAVLILTGIYNYSRVNDFIDKDAFPRYFWVMQVKLTIVVIIVVLVALHAGLLGRRLQQLQESGAPEAEVAAARRWSMAVSMLLLLASIGALTCGILLSAQGWSLSK